MSAWTLISVALSLVTIAAILTRLLYVSAYLVTASRIGLALMAAGLTLNIAPLIANDGYFVGKGPATPFDFWAVSMVRFGLALYLITSVYQIWKTQIAHS